MRVNTKVTFVSTKLYNNDWYNIKLTSNSKTGYVKKDYVKMNSQTQPTTTRPTTTKPSTGSSVKLSVSSKSISQATDLQLLQQRPEVFHGQAQIQALQPLTLVVL